MIDFQAVIKLAATTAFPQEGRDGSQLDHSLQIFVIRGDCASSRHSSKFPDSAHFQQRVIQLSSLGSLLRASPEWGEQFISFKALKQPQTAWSKMQHVWA